MLNGNQKLNKKEMLLEIVQLYRPDLLPLVESIERRLLTAEERETLREVVAKEFSEKELDTNYEPTARGLQLELLIDWLWHMSVDKDQ